MNEIEELNKEILMLNKRLKPLQLKEKELLEEQNKITTKIEILEKEAEEKKNYKIWKEMESKYYHVWLYTVPEEDKFKRCQYAHILQVEKGLLKYEYINIDKGCNYITISSFDFIHERGYKEWTQITKRAYNKIISSTKDLQRLK